MYFNIYFSICQVIYLPLKNVTPYFLKKIKTFFKKLLTSGKKDVIICKAFCFTPILEAIMFEKDLNIGFLLDFYGDVLKDRRREALDLYYNNDMSLSEIAAEMDISRQGVRDLIKKAEEELLFYEEKLGLAKKLKRVEASASQLQQMAKEHSLPKTIEDKIAELVEAVEL